MADECNDLYELIELVQAMIKREDDKTNGASTNDASTDDKPTDKSTSNSSEEESSEELIEEQPIESLTDDINEPFIKPNDEEIRHHNILAMNGGYLRKYFSKYYSIPYNEVENKYKDLKQRFQCTIAVLLNHLHITDVENIINDYIMMTDNQDPIDCVSNTVNENVCRLFSLSEIVLELKFRCMRIRDIKIDKNPYELLIHTAHDILTDKIPMPTCKDLVELFGEEVMNDTTICSHNMIIGFSPMVSLVLDKTMKNNFARYLDILLTTWQLHEYFTQEPHDTIEDTKVQAAKLINVNIQT